MTSYHNQGPVTNQAHVQHIHGNAYFGSSPTQPVVSAVSPSENSESLLYADHDHLTRDKRELCLLSLDNASIRGTPTLLVLKRLMEAVGPADSTPKPCDYFHMIGGASTGGMIALMLGRMRLSVDQCIEAYGELSSALKEIPAQTKLLENDIGDQFDHIALELSIKSLLVRYGFEEDELLWELPTTGKCRTFVCVIDQATNQPAIIATYHNSRRNTLAPSAVKIWEAAMATLATTASPKSSTLNTPVFIGSALDPDDLNMYLCAEANDVWHFPGERIEENVQCLVSIGPDIQSADPPSANLTKYMISHHAPSIGSENTAGTIRHHFQPGNAFRFGVTHSSQDLEMRHLNQRQQLESVTRTYLQREEICLQLTDCAAKLSRQNWLQDLCDAITRTAASEIDALNDEESLLTSGDLQWLTHTKAFQNWRVARYGFVCYRSNVDVSDNETRSVAAAAVYHNAAGMFSFIGPKIGAGNAIARALYFQCDRRQFEVGFSDEVSQTTTPEQVVWSLICQCFLIGCKSEENLRLRLLRLEQPYRDTMLAHARGRKRQNLRSLFSLFTRVLQLNAMPQVLGIDNLDYMDSCDATDFVRQLRELVESDLPRLGRNLPVIISASADDWLYENLRDVPVIHKKTEINECLESLYFPQWDARRSQVADAEEGTNTWIWSHPQYRAWRNGSASVLWIEGKPGSGKSVLAKTLVKGFECASDKPSAAATRRGLHMTKASQTTVIQPKLAQGFLIADWFYTTRGADIHRAHLSLLKSILYQLLSQDQALFELLAPIYRSRNWKEGSLVNDWNCDDIADAMSLMATNGRHVICVIDALDEAESLTSRTDLTYKTPEQSILSQILSTSIKTAGSFLKFIVLSRPDPQIDKDLKIVQRNPRANYKIVLDHENQADVKILIRTGLRSVRDALHTYDSDSDSNPKSSRKYSGLDRFLKTVSRSERMVMERLGKYLEENANGVMLWIALVLSELESLASTGNFSFDSLHQCARKLPLKLDVFYEQIIHKLIENSTQTEISLAKKTFLLIAGSASLGRPLTIREMWEALAVPESLVEPLPPMSDPIKGNLIRLNSWNGFRRHLRRICGPLIEVVKATESCDFSPDGDTVRIVDDVGPDDIVQFMHRTVKDFLEKLQQVNSFHLSEEAAAQKVKVVAKTYLKLCFKEPLPFYRADDAGTANRDWRSRLQQFVEFMDSRALISFALMVSAERKQRLVLPIDLVDLLAATVYRISPQDLNHAEESVGRLLIYYPLLTRFIGITPDSIRTVFLAEAVRCACSSGLLVATANMLDLCIFDSPTVKYGIANGALLAAIEHDLPTEVRELTAKQRHQTEYLKLPDALWPMGGKNNTLELDPFIRFAVRSGAVKIIDLMFDNRDRHYARAQALNEFAVTNQALPEELLEYERQALSSERSDVDEMSVLSIDLDRLIFDDDEGSGHVKRPPAHEYLDLRSVREEKLNLERVNFSADPPALGVNFGVRPLIAKRDFVRERKKARLEYSHLKEECKRLANSIDDQAKQERMQYQDGISEHVRRSVRHVIKKLALDENSQGRSHPPNADPGPPVTETDEHVLDTGSMQADAFARFFNRRVLARFR